MTYAYTLLGGLVAGAFMLPVAAIMFPSPGLGESRPLPIITEPPVNDYEGSVAQSVARGTGRVRTVAKTVYRGVAHVARHARRVTWERPCNLVRKHSKAGAYHDTVSSGRADVFADVARQRDFMDEAPTVVGVGPRHSAEHKNMIAELERMLSVHDFSMRVDA
jgi:hypothetical protein